MIQNAPIWMSLLFLVAFFITLLLFYLSNNKALKLTLCIFFWSVLHSVLALMGFYEITDGFPPRYALVLGPGTLFIIYGLMPKNHAWLRQNRNQKLSTLLHIVRIPVEFVLFGLFTIKMVPELMTFEGRNYDILMGITAPLMLLAYSMGWLNKKGLLVWNWIGLGFILFILINGILSAELPFQMFGFEQPNRGINYFPFILLPATIVPVVVWTHISDIIVLIKKK